MLSEVALADWLLPMAVAFEKGKRKAAGMYVFVGCRATRRRSFDMVFRNFTADLTILGDERVKSETPHPEAEKRLK